MVVNRIMFSQQMTNLVSFLSSYSYAQKLLEHIWYDKNEPVL